MSDALIPPPTRPWWRRLALRLVGTCVRASLWVSPRPMAHLIRRQFAENGRVFGAALMAGAPRGVVAVIDERYDAHPDALLDVYVPPEADAAGGARLATVVWTHGGAFVGGSKDEIGGYLRMIAAAGFTVVGVRYSLAPEARHPTPARQVTAALAHLQANADRLHVDPARLVLAGDSAGAHIGAQLAALTTTPGYADELDIAPTITPQQLRGLVLCCGIYDMSLLDPDSPLRDFTLATGWAYSGRRDYRNDRHFVSTTTIANHVTSAWPPTFITAGNADPLLPQSVALAETLSAAGVAPDTLLYPSDHRPPLGHEYQFDLDGDDGRLALRRLIAFLERCTATDAG